MKFKLRKKQSRHGDECHNHLGFETIEIIKFNYDGMGNALAYFDGELSMLEEDSLDLVLYSGWYKLKMDKNGKK